MRSIISNRDSKAKERRFIREVRTRDWYHCRFQVRKSKNGMWLGCYFFAPDVAHIFSRAQEPAVKYDPRNGIAACRSCHTSYDRHKGKIRVPPERLKEARAAVKELSKLGGRK